MKKTITLLFAITLLFSNWVYSQNTQTVQGQPYDWSQSSIINNQKAKKVTQKTTGGGDPDFKVSDVQFWVGTGTNEAFLVVEWHDDKTPDALVWGYRWNGTAYGIDMILAIAKADPRFYCLLMGGTAYGSAIGGIGYDIDRKGELSLVNNGVTYSPIDGFVNTTTYDFDNWTTTDNLSDHWNAGWYDGYWSYWVKDDIADEWGYSGLGASSRQLVNGSWDGWSYLSDMSNWEGAELGSKFTAATQSVDYQQGTFFVNEDWFGHNNSTVNFLDKDGNWNYRVFQTENPGHELGCTSQFGTIYGGNMYIVSKQEQDPGASLQGSRLAVANARTMQVVNELTDFGANTGDGRSFLGVDENTGYVGTTSGIYIYDIPTGTITGLVSGTASSGGLYSGQIGNMLRVGDLVFALRQSTGVFVINPTTHTVETTIEGDYGSIIMSKDGNLWLSTDESSNAGATLVRLNPYTLAMDNFALPPAAAIPNSWYAWTADGFCASNVTNHIYWKNNGGWFAATKIYKFDADNPTQEPVVIYDSTDPDVNEDTEWGFYGAGFRINPVTDEIFASMYKEFGLTDYKVLKLSTDGDILDEYPMEANYWFPAMPVFPDNYSPEISSDLSKISFKGKTSIFLGDKVTDVDNFNAAIVKSITVDNPAITNAVIRNDSLVLTTTLTAGSTSITLKANSNGKIVTKTIAVNLIDNPVIITQPLSTDVVVDEKATFTVEASGGDLTYQWYRDSVAINYATSSSYSISKVKTTDDGAKFYCVVTNSLGSVSSDEAILGTSIINPEITAQPSSFTKAEKSGTVRFSVTARGGSLSYQWYKDGGAISGATSSSYSITSANLLKTVSGVYYCVVTNSAGSIQSSDAILKVLEKVAITTQPVDVTVSADDTATFSIAATGDELTYQWYKDGTAISDAVYDNLIITPAQDSDEGEYHCIVSNEVSSATSSKVQLTVTTATATDKISMNKLEVYPNPFINHINVNLEHEERVVLTDLSGKILINRSLNAGSNRIETSSLPSGVYLLKVGDKIVKLVK